MKNQKKINNNYSKKAYKIRNLYNKSNKIYNN